jgi:hypothetical protein
MRAGIEITVTPEDRRHLEAVACDRNAKLKHVARPKVILATADGRGTMEVMRRSGLSKPDVWRWQERFMHASVDGLLRDKTRDLLCHAHEKGGAGEECSARLPTSRQPSTATSRSTTPSPSRSCGPPIQAESSLPSTE